MKYILLLSIFSTTVANSQIKQQSNKHFSYTEKTTASPSRIWEIWTDVKNWKKWDLGLKDAQMKEPFLLDAKGHIVSLEGRKSKFSIVEFDEGKSYTFKTKLPLGSLYVKRYLTSQNDETYFTHEVWFKGLTAGIFAKSFGSKFREMLPIAMGNIKKMAEEE